jgi:hypothetical protein
MRHPLHLTLNHWAGKTVILLAASLAVPAAASAQAAVTAQRGAEIAPFVQASIITPDWGPQHNIGYTVGIDYTRLISGIIQPSLELRYISANGLTVDEHSITGGFKIATSIRNIHPYATLLAGTGGILFVHPVPGYPSDTAYIYSLGGGAEFNATENWKIRADFLHQVWNLEPNSLTPVTLSVGIAYSLHFHGGGVR